AVDGVLVLVEVDEVLDAALVLEGRGVAFAALVDDRDLESTGKEGGLAKPFFECLEVEVEHLEDVGVGKEGHLRACRGALCEFLSPDELRLGGSTRVAL